MKTNALNWLNLTIHHPPVAAEAAGALLFGEGAQGVWEDQPDSRGRTVTRSGFDPAERARLEKAVPGIIATLADSFGLDPADFEWSLTLEENHDWAEKWKEGLAPVVVDGRLALAPTWWPVDDLPAAGRVLRLDPGLAFGSGHHATTFLCLQFISELAPQARRILDVGAGSGVLSLAAAALSPAAEVVGVDNDPDTIEVAQDNAAANALADRANFSARNLGELPGDFDLIVANITLGPLTTLAAPISALAPQGGRLVLSGLLETQAAEAQAVYEQQGWTASRRLIRDEWAALMLEKV
ncbi:MAG: 50S ribosomal protein L11 methyltransferase [Candidatus Adiutrix sp.]|jgi:ribosomal protein L11 methyltransferase|nr:50S ribosomal protein L11 methyltransferase [Candidatus Adiutrix sp.]